MDNQATYYINTWSAVKRYRNNKSDDPIESIEKRFDFFKRYLIKMKLASVIKIHVSSSIFFGTDDIIRHQIIFVSGSKQNFFNNFDLNQIFSSKIMIIDLK
jgi:hypothetical protein